MSGGHGSVVVSLKVMLYRDTGVLSMLFTAVFYKITAQSVTVVDWRSLSWRLMLPPRPFGPAVIGESSLCAVNTAANNENEAVYQQQ